MIAEGHLDALIGDLASLPMYWEHMQREYPNHPVAGDSRQWSTSLGCTFYCYWVTAFYGYNFGAFSIEYLMGPPKNSNPFSVKILVEQR